MGVFFGETKCTDAVRAGLKINGAVNGIIQPKLKESYPNTKYVMKHVVGIDVSNVLAIKAGIRNSNDLAWIGKAANHAAKLTGQDASSPTWITDKVYDVMTDAVKYSSGDPKVNMWKQWKWTSQNNRRIYSSTWLIHV
jgi:class 3 adenylate cyclase